MVTAELNNYRQSPRKVRLVVDTVRGKKVEVALANLSFLAKRSALPIKKLIESAVANAKHNNGLEKENLYIKEIRVDEGTPMKRSMPMSRGRAFGIRKNTCHIRVVLDVKESKEASVKPVKALKAPKKEKIAKVKTVKTKTVKK